MARATLNLIYALLALLGVGLLSAAPANAVVIGQNAYLAGSYSAVTPIPASLETRAAGKSVCVHVTERPQETCPVCGTSFVVSIVSRVRPKAAGPRQKAANLPFQPPHAPFEVAFRARHPSKIFGSLSQADVTGTGIIARTGRLRI